MLRKTIVFLVLVALAGNSFGYLRNRPDFSPNSTGGVATIVVAASDTTNEGKSRADFVCDGTADNVDIQAAIDALPATGGKVVLLDGTFSISDQMTIPDFVTIEGVGPATILFAAADLDDRIFENADTSGGNSDIELRNFKIDGNSTDQTSGPADGMKFLIVTGLVIDGLIIDDCKNNCILIVTSSEVFISNCKLSNSEYGMFFANVDNFTITNVQSFGQSDDGMAIAAAGGACQYGHFSSCQFYGNGDKGVHVNGGLFMSFAACDFSNNTGIGIAATDTSNFVSITGCIAESNGGHGIQIAATGLVTVTGNACHDNTDSGISCATVTDLTVTGNVCIDNTIVGITFTSCTDWIATGNRCGNDTATAQNNGILVQTASTRGIISGNNLDNNSTANIQVLVAGVKVFNNEGTDETVTAGSPTLHTWGSTSLNSAGGAITGTLASGRYIGEIKTIVMTEASTSSTITITNHDDVDGIPAYDGSVPSGDGEVGTFNAVDETWILMWTGTEWTTIRATCTFV